jgi:hypothetical protein
VGRASISTSKIIESGSSVTLGIQDRGIRTSSKAVSYRELVEKMMRMHVLFYDYDCARGWLVDGATAALHLLHSRVAFHSTPCDDETSSLNHFHHANPQTGGKAAKETLLSLELSNMVFVGEPAAKAEKQDREAAGRDATVRTGSTPLVKKASMGDQVRDLYEILESMYDNWKRRKNTTSILLQDTDTYLEGWRIQDIVELEKSMKPVVVRLDGVANDWLRMVRHIDAVVLFGNNLGDMMRPMGNFCASWRTVPQKDFCMAVTVSQLKRIASKHGDPTKVPIMLIPPIKSEPGVFWPIDQYPFACTCATQVQGKTECHRPQKLRSDSLWSGRLQLDILTAAKYEHENGAVIFEGRISSRHSKMPSSPNIEATITIRELSRQTTLQESLEHEDKTENSDPDRKSVTRELLVFPGWVKRSKSNRQTSTQGSEEYQEKAGRLAWKKIVSKRCCLR